MHLLLTSYEEEDIQNEELWDEDARLLHSIDNNSFCKTLETFSYQREKKNTLLKEHLEENRSFTIKNRF